LDKYDVEKEISGDGELLKKRTSIDAKPRMKHLIERWIMIETEHLPFT